MSYEFRKSNCQVYTIRGANGWAGVIYLSEETSEITVAMGYQHNWHHCWPYPGRGVACKTLKNFLVKASHGYIMDKFSYGSEPYLKYDESAEQLKKEIEGNRDAMRDFEDNIEGNEVRNTHEWYAILHQCESIMDHYEGDFYALPCITDVHPQLRGFIEKVWPKFVKVLRAEIEYDSRPQ